MNIQCGRRVAAASICAVMMGGCGTSGPASPDEPDRYRLVVTAGSADIRSLLVSVGGLSGAPSVLQGASIFSRVTAGSPARVLMVGQLSGVPLLEVRVSTPGQEPIVSIHDASGGSNTSYARIPSSGLTIDWQPID